MEKESSKFTYMICPKCKDKRVCFRSLLDYCNICQEEVKFEQEPTIISYSFTPDWIKTKPHVVIYDDE